ncbi:hypothetical protein ACIQXM_13475 [Arthrobacter sp. NPDC097144]|uniref:hypothetical protein n=1 Tax=Arthrobacter sp. NPDC097144 TaxID=3363946 RepID=UPI00380C48BA
MLTGMVGWTRHSTRPAASRSRSQTVSIRPDKPQLLDFGPPGHRGLPWPWLTSSGIPAFGPPYLSILHKDPADELIQGLRRRFDGPVLLNTGFGTVTSREDAIMLLEEDLAEAVVVGCPVIANPDLARWQDGKTCR